MSKKNVLEYRDYWCWKNHWDFVSLSTLNVSVFSPIFNNDKYGLYLPEKKQFIKEYGNSLAQMWNLNLPFCQKGNYSHSTGDMECKSSILN